MIVIDTNVLCYALIEGSRTKIAQQVLYRDPAWRLPTLWRHEFLNVLALYVRHGGTSIDDAISVWEIAAERGIQRELEVDPSRALEIAVEKEVTAYDAQFAALAEELDVPLVTEDRQLQRGFPDRAVSMSEFLGT